jgi:hypothetical protein
MDRMTAKERARFDNKTIPQGECVIMNVPLDPDGYATFYFRRKNRRAHRIAYWAAIGDIPDGMVVDHTCGTRNCVRPAHLRLLTPTQHAFRNRRDLCKNGHPFDRVYGPQRYCSICDAAKKRRLKAKWQAEGLGTVVGL